MSEKYRFLRFESLGLSTVIFLILCLLPLFFDQITGLVNANLENIIAIIAAVFLLSLPFGYIIHQLVVNKYRSHKIKRIIINILDDIIIEIINSFSNQVDIKNLFYYKFDEKMKISFLTELFDLLLSQDESAKYINAKNRLSSLWSHFYARKAIGCYAPKITTITYFLILILICLIYPLETVTGLNIFVSFVIMLFILIIGFKFIDPYSEKIWFEINFFEMSFLLSEMRVIKPILQRMVFYLVKNQYRIEYNTKSWSWELYKDKSKLCVRSSS